MFYKETETLEDRKIDLEMMPYESHTMQSVRRLREVEKSTGLMFANWRRRETNDTFHSVQTPDSSLKTGDLGVQL